MDGTLGSCDGSFVTYGSMRWGATITVEDSYAEANIGYDQSLTFIGPRAGTPGYIALYVWDYFTTIRCRAAGVTARW